MTDCNFIDVVDGVLVFSITSGTRSIVVWSW